MVVALIIGVFSPVLVNLSLRLENRLLTQCLAYAGYLWMAGLFLHCCLYACYDTLRFSTRALSTFFSGVKGIGNHNGLFPVVSLTVVCILGFGGFEARHIRKETVRLETSKLPPGVDRIRIVQVSDIHFSTINNEYFAEEVAGLLKSLNPDILVSTGDLIDRGLFDRRRVADLLRNLETPLGKYAVAGNHEFYAGLDDALNFTERAGFRVLRNEAVRVHGLVTVVGVDDPAGARMGLPPPDEKGAFSEVRGDLYTLLLKHRPRVNSDTVGRFDLQLSGHTHDGQIFPFKLVTAIFYPYIRGFFSLAEGGALYVSRGTGTFGPPVRFLAPPEVTVIDLETVQAGAASRDGSHAWGRSVSLDRRSMKSRKEGLFGTGDHPASSNPPQ